MAVVDTLQAAFLLEKMKIFPEEVQMRQVVAARYDDLLPKSLKRQTIKPFNQSVYAQYTIEVEQRDQVEKALQARGIPTAVHYPLGLHEQPIFKELYPEKQSFVHSENASRACYEYSNASLFDDGTTGRSCRSFVWSRGLKSPCIQGLFLLEINAIRPALALWMKGILAWIIAGNI